MPEIYRETEPLLFLFKNETSWCKWKLRALDRTQQRLNAIRKKSISNPSSIQWHSSNNSLNKVTKYFKLQLCCFGRKLNSVERKRGHIFIRKKKKKKNSEIRVKISSSKKLYVFMAAFTYVCKCVSDACKKEDF